MSIKHILVPLTGHALSRETLQAGMDLAGRFGACAHVVHIRQDPALAMAYAGAGAGGMGAGAGMAAIMEAAEGEAAERERRARALFDEVAAGRADAGRADAELHVETGSETDLLAAYARLSDLVVFQRPGEDGSSSLERDIEAVLFESGRPIFLVPPKSGTLAEHPGTIVVGWNDSPEAARALGAALPFLKGARRTVIVSIGEAAPEKVAAYLKCHDIAAEAIAVPSDSGLFDDPTGALLLQACAEQGAGMLVMGAFTHMRIRQLVIAGATRTVMAKSPLPVLMMH